MLTGFNVKKLLLIFFISFSFFFIGCEQTVEEEDFPYELKIVVRGIIEAGKPIKDIYIGRTLPVTVKYYKEYADLTDAAVAITVDDSVYILKHTSNGLYSLNNLIPVKGKKYILIAQWQDKRATAETVVPIAGTIIGGSLINKTIDGKKTYYLESQVFPNNDEAYVTRWQALTINGNVAFESKEYGQCLKKSASSQGNILRILSSEVSTSYISSSFSFAVKFSVFDGAFYDYYITAGTNQVADAIFGQSNANVRWNIKGDGIGMFIAKTDTVVKL